jgi:hypothetical protein
VTLHAHRLVNNYKCRISGYWNPNVTSQLETDSAKMNVWCCIMHDTVTGTFFFSEPTTTTASYLNMREPYALYQLPPGTTFEQNGTLPHYSNIITNHIMPHRWISRVPNAWPPTSPE